MWARETEVKLGETGRRRLPVNNKRFCRDLHSQFHPFVEA